MLFMSFTGQRSCAFGQWKVKPVEICVQFTNICVQFTSENKTTATNILEGKPVMYPNITTVERRL